MLLLVMHDVAADDDAANRIVWIICNRYTQMTCSCRCDWCGCFPATRFEHSSLPLLHRAET
jgi:hypothetical protein